MTSVAISTPDSGSRTVYRAAPRRRAPARRRAPVRRRRVTTRRVRSGIRRYAQTGGRPLLSKFALANIDPFNPRADGCKIPDANTYPSTSLRLEDEITMTTDAVFKVAATAFRPFSGGISVLGTAASANSWTWAAAYAGSTASSRQPSLTGNYLLSRCVAHGIRLSCAQAPTAVTGFVHVAIFAENLAGTTWAYPVNISGMNNCMYYARYPLAKLTQQSVTVVNKFLDSSASHYFDPNSFQAGQESNISMQSERGWGTIVVAVDQSTASTNVVTVESVLHYECTPKADGVNTATAAAAYNIDSLQTVSRIAGGTPGSFVEGEEQSYFQAATQAMGKGMHSIAREYVPRAAYAFGRYAAYQGLGRVSRGIQGVNTGRTLSSGFAGMLTDY